MRSPMGILRQLIDREPHSATSEYWNSREYVKTGRKVTVIDADGWDRKNFKYSYYEELISKREYQRRLCESTLSIRIHSRDRS